MKLLQSRAPASRTDRYATQLLHDEPGVRIVSFRLAGGQEVPPHASTSTVVVHVLEGTGVFGWESLEQGPRVWRVEISRR
jgi:quercetin dioxygenase-like cupin family protein